MFMMSRSDSGRMPSWSSEPLTSHFSSSLNGPIIKTMLFPSRWHTSLCTALE